MRCFIRSAAVATVAGAAMVALAGCSREVTVAYPSVPSTLPLRSTTTTSIGVDRTKLALPTDGLGVSSTTTIGFRPAAPLSLTGVVTGPDGPVPGARVRVERLVGSAAVAQIVDADDQGRYQVAGVELGRLRVRAWKAPDLAMTQDDVFFASSQVHHDLAVANFGRTDVQWAMAPANPKVGEKANVVIQVSTRAVDEEGKISVVPLSGVGVSVYPTGVLVPLVLGERLTNVNGRAIFTLRCDGSGNSGLDVRLATGGQATLAPPPCQTPVVTVPATTVSAPTEPPTTVVSAPIEAGTAPAPVPADQAPISLVPVPVIPQ
jgi:hypothetical protein